MFKAFTTIALLTLLALPTSHAESIYSEQDKLIRGGDAIGTLGADLFGDKVNFYNGTLEFTQTDVSLPGNNALPVSVGRRLVPGSEVRTPGVFADWDLDIPHLHGVFARGAQSVYGNGWSAQYGGGRCSNYSAPPNVSYQGGSWTSDEYWHGSFMYLPGAGSQEILSRAGTANNNVPTDGNAWPLVTRSMASLRCIATQGGGGEGFLAITPDGTQYRFDWLVSRTYPGTAKPGPLPVGFVAGPSGVANAVNLGFAQASVVRVGPGGTANVMMGYGLNRQEVWIMPTLVTDRHGNTVTYTYNPAKPWQVTSIQSSDGRTITFAYDAISGLVTSVNDGSRSWSYTYVSDLAGKKLDRVTQPDLAYWSYSMGSFTSSRPMYLGPPDCETEGGLNTLTETGSMTHPSGATGTFVITPTTHSRSFVEKSCRGIPADGDYAVFPRFIASRSIVSKTITNLNLPAMVWTYSYSTATSSASWLGCTVNCLDYKTVEVSDPRSVLTRYTFGNRFRVTEGQLQKVEVGPVGGAPLRTTTTRYRAPDALPTSYSSFIGISPQKRGNGELAGRNTPVDQRVTNQQGVNFTWQADPNSFDVMARPHTVTRSSGLNLGRTETTVYADHLSKWVLGQIQSVTETNTGKVMVSNVYDTSTANLLSTSKFGFPYPERFTYYPDGTLWTRVDGLSQTTTFSNYYRGLARNAQYADGRTESATIDNLGLIRSVTDANTFTTTYDYDLMGRLKTIIRPTGDTVVWNSTSLIFEPVAADEYGLGAGHWRQTITTGKAKTITYFDALWRPRVTRTFDSTNLGTEGDTAKTVLRNFDSDNRKVFESYPARNVASITATPPGTSTAYDSLGRPFKAYADSELALLTTSIDYLTGFQKRVTNPRGFATTTGYQVFDEPSESAIASIAAPETLSLSIARDRFGKPTSITRSGTTGGAVSVTRSYVYDSYERLCKTIEPEIGATIQLLDAANNTTWRATGRELSTSLVCDPGSVSPYYKVSYGYDTRNRLTRTSFADGYPSITRTYTPDGLPATVVTAAAGVPGFSTWAYGYNKRRLLEQETLTYAGQSYPIAWNFDPSGHTSQLTYPDGAVLAYTPNALGEATQVGSYATSVKYWPNGAVSGYTLGSGITNLLYQNTRGLPNWSRDSGVTQDLYSYDAGGNLTAITDQWENINRTMGYDGLDRLTSTSAPLIWGNATYGYDALDNIRTSIVGSRNSTHTYDGINRLSYITTNGAYSFYLYDTRGNITARGGKGFYFDLGNRMQNSNDAYYTYDGLGRRTSINAADGTTKIQVYSQTGKLLYGTQQQGMVLRNTRYVYLGNKLIAEVGTSTGTEYVHTDVLGSPVARTNSSGVLLTRTRYEPYGNTAAGTVPNGIGFTGHVNDPDTGLVYMQQRYYDPIAARFMSLDPVTTDANTGGSFGRYHYANNNPYRFTDADGRDPTDRPTRDYWDLPSKPDCGCATPPPNPTLPPVTVTAARVAPTPMLLAYWFSLTMAEIYGKKVKESLVQPATAKAAEGGASPPPENGDDKKKKKDNGKQQDRMLSKKEIKDVEEALGEDIHDIKGGTNASKYDLYKRGDGEVVMKPKGGAGPGEPIGFKFPNGG